MTSSVYFNRSRDYNKQKGSAKTRDGSSSSVSSNRSGGGTHPSSVRPVSGNYGGGYGHGHDHYGGRDNQNKGSAGHYGAGHGKNYNQGHQSSKVVYNKSNGKRKKNSAGHVTTNTSGNYNKYGKRDDDQNYTMSGGYR